MGDGLKNRHRTYRKVARRFYRLLIVLCTLALIAAILLWYFRQPAVE